MRSEHFLEAMIVKGSFSSHQNQLVDFFERQSVPSLKPRIQAEQECQALLSGATGGVLLVMGDLVIGLGLSYEPFNTNPQLTTLLVDPIFTEPSKLLLFHQLFAECSEGLPGVLEPSF